jgi:tRNA 2-thiocytidine biosynthesis protein TtcA
MSLSRTTYIWHIASMLDETEIHPLFECSPSTTEFKKLRRRIVRYTREAIEQYGMIERDAKWLVCLSGGKDSYTLLAVLYELKWQRFAAG